MIDTDKYEGHTPAPWILGSSTEKNSNGHRTSYGTYERPIIYSDVAIRTNYKGQKMSVMIGQVNRESAQLIADAPLLLEEVKRLRGIIDYIRDTGRMVKPKEVFGLYLSIMEKVLTTDEYIRWHLEWRDD